MPRLPLYLGQNNEDARRGGELTSRSELSPDAFGAGIGKALAGVGEATQGAAAALKGLQDRKANTDGAIAVANLMRDAQIELTTRSSNAPPDGSGVADGFKGWFDDKFDELIAGSATDDQRRYFMERKATLGASFIPRAVEFQTTKAAGYAKTQTGEAINGIYSSIERDPTLFDTYFKQGLDLIENHYALTPTDRDAVSRTFKATAAKAYFNTVIDGAETLEQTAAIEKRLLDGKDPVSSLLDPDSLTAQRANVKAQERSIQSGISALVQQESSTVIEQLKAGQPLDPAYLNDVTQKVLKFGTPAVQRAYIEQLKISEQRLGLRGAPKDVLEGQAKFGPGGDARTQAAALLRQFEGFAGKAKWDVNHFRLGYGSDTITTADGKIVSVKEGDTVSAEDAERDLQRRLPDFMNAAAEGVGAEFWKLPARAQAALTSLTYNYGHVPASVAAAARTGDMAALAKAFESLPPGSKDPQTAAALQARREKEAAYIRGAGDGGRTEFFQQQAGKQALDAYNAGMKADGTKFVMDYTPQFFKGDHLDTQTGEGVGDRFRGVQSARDFLDEPTSNIPLLTKGELDEMNENIELMDDKQRVAFAANIQKELGGNSGELWKLLKDKQPEMAYAGFMLAHDESTLPVAYDLVRGGSVLKAKYPDAKPDTAITNFFKDLDATKRVPDDLQKVFQAVPGRLDEIQRAADVLYIFRNRFGGDFNQDKYRQALTDVMGGSRVENVNGAPTLLPKDVDARTMEKALDNLTPAALTTLSVNGGQPVYASVDHEGKPVTKPITPENIANEGHLEAVGPDTYALRMSFDNGYALDSKALGEKKDFQSAIYTMRLSPAAVKTLATSAANPAAPAAPVVKGQGAPGENQAVPQRAKPAISGGAKPAPVPPPTPEPTPAATEEPPPDLDLRAHYLEQVLRSDPKYSENEIQTAITDLYKAYGLEAPKR